MAGKHASGYGERETKTYTEKSKPKKKRKSINEIKELFKEK